MPHPQYTLYQVVLIGLIALIIKIPASTIVTNNKIDMN